MSVSAKTLVLVVAMGAIVYCGRGVNSQNAANVGSPTTNLGYGSNLYNGIGDLLGKGVAKGIGYPPNN